MSALYDVELRDGTRLGLRRETATEAVLAAVRAQEARLIEPGWRWVQVSSEGETADPR